MKYLNWIKESNRPKHLLYAIPCGLAFSILFVAGIAIGMEFKDKAWGSKWDWLDLIATLLGGLIGQLLQILLIWLLVKGHV